MFQVNSKMPFSSDRKSALQKVVLSKILGKHIEYCVESHILLLTTHSKKKKKSGVEIQEKYFLSHLSPSPLSSAHLQLTPHFCFEIIGAEGTKIFIQLNTLCAI